MCELEQAAPCSLTLHVLVNFHSVHLWTARVRIELFLVSLHVCTALYTSNLPGALRLIGQYDHAQVVTTPTVGVAMENMGYIGYV